MSTEFKIPEHEIPIFQSYLDKIESETKIDIFKKMKAILNLSFGEANNQILKMDVKELEKYHYNVIMNEGRQGVIGSATLNKVEKFFGGMAYMMIVWFPEIKITNSRGTHRTIRDLYVRMPLSYDGRFTGTMEGIRTTLTKEEWNAGYLHSHLPDQNGRATSLRFERFCLGVGEIVQTINVLRHAFDEINFNLFCLHLKNYVKWESLEGHPYIGMSTVATRNSATIAQDLTGTSFELIVDKMYNHILSMETPVIRELFAYTLSEKGIIVSPTENLELLLSKKIEEQRPTEFGRYISIMDWALAYKDSMGTYYSINTTASILRRRIPDETLFTFKGEPKKLTINTLPNQIKTERKYAHPSITQELCWRLTCQITKAAFGAGGNSSRANTANHI